MVEAQHQEAIEQVILNLKAQVAGLNQQIEVLSKLNTKTLILTMYQVN